MPGLINLTSFNNWLIPLCFAIGFGLAFLYYRKDKKFTDLRIWKVRLMMILRGFTISLLLVLLLSPMLQSQKKTVSQPIIVIAADNSSSLKYNNDSASLQNISNKINYIIDELKGDYEVKTFLFGGDVREGSEVNFNEEETNMDKLFNEIGDRYQNRNVGAMVLFSDGLYNRGANPIYGSNSFNFPVHVIGIGDTTKKRDVKIRKVNHNDIAYLGNTFPLQVELENYGFDGENYTLLIKQNGKTIRSSGGKFNSGQSVINENFQLKADEAGVRKYEVEVKLDSPEENKSNNKKFVFVEVLDGRQEILVLTDAPHPDIGALVNAISSFENYALKVQLLREFQASKQSYDLMVLHEIPSKRIGLKKEIIELLNNTPSLFIIGKNTSVGGFNQLDLGLNLSIDTRKTNEALPLLSQNFSIFSISNDALETIENLPPLNTPFGEYKFYSDYESLFTQKIGRVKSDFPLIAFNKKGNTKYGYIMGEGIWRWRLRSYKKNGNHEVFNELIGKIVQYLSVKTDKSRLRINSKNNFLENERILFEAEVYNQSYELDNKADLEIKITDSAGKSFDFVFSRTSNAYSLNAGSLPEGTYTYTAFTRGEKTEKLSKSGTFLISPLQLESFKTASDFQFLYALSQKLGGAFYPANDVDLVIEDIRSDENIRPITHVEEIPEDLINFKILFFIILLCIGSEWYLRKRNGAY